MLIYSQQVLHLFWQFINLEVMNVLAHVMPDCFGSACESNKWSQRDYTFPSTGDIPRLFKSLSVGDLYTTTMETQKVHICLSWGVDGWMEKTRCQGFIAIFYLHLLCICSVNHIDFHQLITELQYLDWDIDSTNVKLNTDKGVWCLLESRFATRGPPQHSTRCHRNRACYEDNKTATMATTGGVTRNPGSHGSSSKHDTCALKVKNIHRLNARYWTWAQRVLCLWVGCMQSSGWPLQFFYWRAER